MEGKGVVRVEIIGKQTVKPSSPTSPHLCNLKLSHLDQLARPVYFPLILFFQSNQSKSLTTSNHLQISQHLKHSLSLALLPFYPLAGALHVDDPSVVHCNDAGVEFVDARAHACITDVVPDMQVDLKQFLPLDPTAAVGSRPFLLVQLTFFDCGGVAVGVCFSHLVADCVSVMALLDAWAAACRWQQVQVESLRVSFDLQIYFPPRVSVAPRLPTPTTASVEKLVTRRFVFDKDKLTCLKKSVAAALSPTRVELVSGFIWQSFLKAGRMKRRGGGGGEDNYIQAAYQVVNLRPRFNPPGVLDNVMGNGVMFTFALADGDGDGGGGVVEYEELLRRLRCSIKKIDHDYISRARDGDEYGEEHARFFCRGGVETCSFSSWTRFPVYEVDFGWGGPVWCCTTALPVKNLTVLVSSRDGEDIEAWVNMNEDKLETLQTQFQLISTINS